MHGALMSNHGLSQALSRNLIYLLSTTAQNLIDLHPTPARNFLIEHHRSRKNLTHDLDDTASTDPVNGFLFMLTRAAAESDTAVLIRYADTRG